jgi:hypothetical protein
VHKYGQFVHKYGIQYSSLSTQLVQQHKVADAKCLSAPAPPAVCVCVLRPCAADLLPVLKVLQPSRTPQEAALVSGVWPLLMHVTYNMPGQLTQDQVSGGLCNAQPAHTLFRPPAAIYVSCLRLARLAALVAHRVHAQHLVGLVWRGGPALPCCLTVVLCCAVLLCTGAGSS